MSSILSAIHDDIERYRQLCVLYGERMVMASCGQPDPYCDHAAKLILRSHEESKKKREGR